MSHLYLAHHGIKGMKWGIRRFRNYDGSLTSAGKKRYGVNDTGKQYGIADKGSDTHHSYERLSGSPGKNYIDSRFTASGSDVVSLANKMKSSAEALIDRYVDAEKDVADAVRQVSRNPEAKQEALSVMQKWFVSPSMVDDVEYVEFSARDVADELVRKYVHETDSGKRVDALQGEMDRWFDDAKSETNRVVSDRGDVVVGSDQYGDFNYRDVVYSTVVQSAPAYFPHMVRDGLWEPYLYNDGVASDALDDFSTQIYNDFMKNG